MGDPQERTLLHPPSQPATAGRTSSAVRADRFRSQSIAKGWLPSHLATVASPRSRALPRALEGCRFVTVVSLRSFVGREIPLPLPTRSVFSPPT